MDKRTAQILSDKIIDELVVIRKQKNITPYRIWKGTELAQSTISDIEKHEIHPTMYVTLMIAEFIGADLGAIIQKITKE